ncbi:hypothetical protein AcV7_001145 [Taiwanofungus camphoratus]|nr:hypothetical protein AcV7_001145 [Antrodia cinnamomea]
MSTQGETIHAAWVERKDVLEQVGLRIVEVPTLDGKINVPELLVALRNLGIRSLMVEGGARVIRSFLAEAGLHSGASEEGASDGVVRSAVDTVIITVAPTLVGRDGIGYGNELVGGELPTLVHVETRVFGCDSVVVLKSI